MAWPLIGQGFRFRTAAAAHLAERQHRNAYALLVSQGLGAATGLLFWLLFARLVPAAEIGLAGAIILMGTAVAVIAKGGFDTAIVRSIPAANTLSGRRLLRIATGVSLAAAVLLAFVLAAAAVFTPVLPRLGTTGWLLVSAIAALLVVTWLQDAYFLAEGDAIYILRRNAWLSATRLLLPVPIVLLLVPQPVVVTWVAALAVSAIVAASFFRRFTPRGGPGAETPVFMRRAVRNVMGGAAEFLPGLLLVPIVLALAGATSAGHFTIAWSAASLLFIASAAIGRSALTELARAGQGPRGVLRRAMFQHLGLLLPAAAIGVLLAPHLMGIFGPAYAAESATAFALLCASIIFVGPAYLYLTVLRARDQTLPLVVFPLALIAAVVILVPVLHAQHGLAGVALAWLLANAPFGAYGAWRIARGMPRDMPQEMPQEALP